MNKVLRPVGNASAFRAVCRASILATNGACTGWSTRQQDCSAAVPRAIELRAAGSYEAALEQLEMHNRCDKSPVRMSYFYHLGWTYHEMGRYEEALQAYDNGLLTQPD